MRKYLYIPENEIRQEHLDEDFDGFAVGSEYCYFLLPDKEELKSLSVEVASTSKDLIILLPYLRDDQIEDVVELVNPYAGKTNLRLIVNDWGTLWVASRMLQGLEIIPGRLISGQKWGVRSKSSPFLTERGRVLLSSDLLASPSVKEFLSSGFGITRVGVSPLSASPPVDDYYRDRIVHFPYVLVTVTDYCPYMGNTPSGLLPACDAPCRKGYVTLKNPGLGFDMFQRGKGRFFNPMGGDAVAPVADDGEFIIYETVP